MKAMVLIVYSSRCRYFFHATTARKETEEFNVCDSDTEEDAEPPVSPTASGKSNAPPEGKSDPRSSDHSTREEDADERKDLSQDNPLAADWFDVGALREKSAKGKAPAEDSETETESETEPEDEDSENEDVRPEPDVVNDDDDWERIERDSQNDAKVGNMLVHR